MAQTYNMQEAKSQLSQLADRAANGEEIVIARDGHPLARLVSVEQPSEPRLLRPPPEAWLSEAWLSEVFDYPLPTEIELYLEAERD